MGNRFKRDKEELREFFEEFYPAMFQGDNHLDIPDTSVRCESIFYDSVGGQHRPSISHREIYELVKSKFQ